MGCSFLPGVLSFNLNDLFKNINATFHFSYEKSSCFEMFLQEMAIECDQEMPQIHTSDQPTGAGRGDTG